MMNSYGEDFPPPLGDFNGDEAGLGLPDRPISGVAVSASVCLEIKSSCGVASNDMGVRSHFKELIHWFIVIAPAYLR